MAVLCASGTWIEGRSGLGSAHPVREFSQPVGVVGLVEGLLACVDVGLLAGARQPDVGALLGGVLGDDQVGGVGGTALGGEWMLDVR